MANDSNWYTTAFNSRYPQLYSHRDYREAELLYDTLTKHAMLFPAGNVLDAACGAGRWIQCLATHGYQAIGFDLSKSQLAHTQGLTTIRANLLHFPFLDSTFQQVVSLFSSFGYFSDESLDRQQLYETSRVLVPGGYFILDTMPFRVLDEIVPKDSFTFPDGVNAQITRERQSDRIVKRIRLSNSESWEERLRIYPTGRLDRIAQDCGLQLVRRFGDYDGQLFDENHSPRVISCYVRNR